MKVAELLVAGLEAAGVTTAYGVPGEENTQLMLALEASGIDVVLTRHEQAAAFMAGVHGRITGMPAMCFATLGPGATNLTTGVADATLDYVPMIVITGQGARDRIGKAESHQVIDLEKLFEPVTKLSRRLMRAGEVNGALAEAVRVACTARPGAVHLVLPEDLAEEDTEDRPVKPTPVEIPNPSPKAMVRALDVLTQAERPLIVAGAGVIRSNAAADLRKLVEAAHLPLATTFMAKGILAPDHPLHLHCIGQPFDDHIDELLADRDLVVTVGFDPIEVDPGAITGDGAIPVLHIGETPATLEHDWYVKGDLPGAIGQSLRGITSGLAGKTWPGDRKVAEIRDRITRQRAALHAVAEGRLHPADVMRSVEATLSGDTLVLSGVGTHKMEVARYLAATRPGQIIIPNGLAGMGIALPGAIAASRLGRHRRVLAICGDGELLMNVQEMETAARLGLSFTVLVLEDGGYGLIKAKQKADTGQHTELSFGNPEWDSLARSFGWTHHRVSDTDTLAAVLDDHRTGLNLVTVPIDYAGALKRDDSAMHAA